MLRFLFCAFIMPLLLVGCLGISKKSSNTKVDRTAHEKRVKIKAPGRIDPAPSPEQPPTFSYEFFEKDSHDKEKEKSASFSFSGLLIPLLGAGLILLSIGLGLLNWQTGGALKRVGSGVSALWEKANNMQVHADKSGAENEVAGKFKRWIETVAAEHNIKL